MQKYKKYSPLNFISQYFISVGNTPTPSQQIGLHLQLDLFVHY